MKLIHLSDLHLGKRVNGFSMLEDQHYILREILKIIDREAPDGVLIAGDVYDKSVPPAEAVALLDEFLVELSRRQLQVYLISGNHDSPERLAFGGRLMDQSGVHVAPVYDGRIVSFTQQDQYGSVEIFLLPFLKPAHVRRFFPDDPIDSYTDALRTVLSHAAVPADKRTVLVTHQFVTGASRCDSEDLSVGGSDNVDAAAFAPFDYVALGHIHNPQSAGAPHVRYCGTPLKYSFSEAAHEKSVTVVELREKGTVDIRTIPLKPLRDMAELRGTYESLTFRGFYEGTSYPGDYLHITLTDEEDIPDAISKLRVIYPNLMQLSYDNARTRSGALAAPTEQTAQKSPLELAEIFYEGQNGQPMSDAQREFLRGLMERIWEEEV
ncbi:exonuclease SbcCD subunit D [uncultured Oscillibacter sp.]|uniref:exonuclease SbcCD subunit D n=1 Tax=uncultured Oscillibacter sp. TaxID=876091 RepID=UPI00280ADC3B|nr:exonuclease SbcCD subunit D [uncultured Oscillibacter sp.]